MKFNDFLKAALEKSGLSKKEIIRRTGIDKSTCYQYFNGKRTPTEDHILLMLDAFQLSRYDNEILLEVYQKERYGDSILDRRRLAARCLKILAGAETASLPVDYVQVVTKADLPESRIILETPEEIRTRIYTLLKNEIEKDGEVSVFVSSQFLRTYQLLPIMAYLADQAEPGRARIRQIFSFPSTRKDITNSVMQSFTEFLPLLISDHLIYDPFYYYDDASAETCIGFLFPNYIITDESVFLIRSDGLQAMEYAVPPMVRCYHDAFEIAARKSERIRKKFANLSQLTHYATEHGQDGPVYNISQGPCACIMADEAGIRRYVPEELQDKVSAYLGGVKQLPLVTFNFPGCLEEFARTGRFYEGGISAQIEPADRKRFLSCLLDQLGDRLFLINEDKLPPMLNWEILCQSGNGLMVEGREDDGAAFVIREKNIVEAFIDFFRYNRVQGWLMNVHAAREWLQSLIESIEKQEEGTGSFLA